MPVNRLDAFRVSWRLVAVPLVVALPNVLLGIHGGDDFGFHVPTWLDAAAQNTLLPRWAVGANFGYGDARFLFYPPLSWIMGGLLCKILPSAFAIAFYVFFCGVIASSSMYLLAREFISRSESMVAGMFFAVSPYFLYDMYRRAAYAEALAMALLPGSVALLLRIQKLRRPRDIALFALSFSLIWLANIPLALISSVTFSILTLVLSVAVRDWRFAISAAWGGLLAMGLTAFYALPVIAQLGWIDAHQLGSRIQSFRSFSLGESTLVAVVIVHGLAAAIALIRIRSPRLPLVVLAGLPLIMLSPISLPFWRLPGASNIQFPYRWLSVLALTYGLAAGLVLGARHRWITVGTILGLGALVTAPAMIHRRSAGLQEMNRLREAIAHGHGYQEEGEWTPLQFRLRPAMKNDPLASFVPDRGNSTVHVQLWTAEHKIVETDSPEQSTMRFHLAFYPLWRITANGGPIPALPDENGVLQTNLPPGRNRIEISFSPPPLQSWGILISLLSVALMGRAALSVSAPTDQSLEVGSSCNRLLPGTHQDSCGEPQRRAILSTRVF